MSGEEWTSELVVLNGAPTRLTQLHRHTPDVKPSGDCYRTAIACLLGASDPAWVPHFVDEAPPGPWLHIVAARHWLRDFCQLDLMSVRLDFAQEAGVPYLAHVQSGRGPWGHIVIAQGVEVVHDPSGRTDYTLDDLKDPAEPVDVICRPYTPDPDEMVRRWSTEAAA